MTACAPPPPVPSPTVTITGSPFDEGFHTGLLLTFTGRAEFHPAVNTQLDVDEMWTKTAPTSDLSADPHVSISDLMIVSMDPIVFVSNLTINTLDQRTDSGTYTLSLVISSPRHPFVVGTMATESHTITVLSEFLWAASKFMWDTS